MMSYQDFKLRSREKELLKEIRSLADVANRKKDLNYARQQAADRVAHGRALELQELVNKGGLDKQILINRGNLNERALEDKNMVDRLMIEESGLDRRQGRKFDFELTKPVFEETKTKKYDELGNVTEESSNWNNVNTLSARLHGSNGRTVDSSDMDRFSGRVSRSQKTESSSPPQIDASKIKKAIDLDRGSGFIQMLDSGKQFDIINGRSYDPEDVSQNTPLQRTPQTNPLPSVSQDLLTIDPVVKKNRQNLIIDAPGVEQKMGSLRDKNVMGALGGSANRFSNMIQNRMDQGIRQKKNKYPFRNKIKIVRNNIGW